LASVNEPKYLKGIMKKEKFWGTLGNFDPNLKTSKCGFWEGIFPGFKVKKWLNFESICQKIFTI
jgi:hypothetical protein